jgi:hypothetical protein
MHNLKMCFENFEFYSRRKAILDLERTPSFEKQSTRFFFVFEYAHFENQQWLEIVLVEYWMNGWTLRLWALRRLGVIKGPCP